MLLKQCLFILIFIARVKDTSKHQCWSIWSITHACCPFTLSPVQFLSRMPTRQYLHDWNQSRKRARDEAGIWLTCKSYSQLWDQPGSLALPISGASGARPREAAAPFSSPSALFGLFLIFLSCSMLKSHCSTEKSIKIQFRIIVLYAQKHQGVIGSFNVLAVNAMK